MSFNKSNSDNLVAFIFQGKIITPAKEDSNYDVERNGRKYLSYDSVSGILTSISLKDSSLENEKNVILTIQDGEEKINLYINMNSSNFRTLFRTLPNANLFQEIELFPLYKVNDDKTEMSIIVKQRGEFLKRYFTRDNMGDMPVAIPVEANGKTIYDYSEQNTFLFNLINDKLQKEKMPF